MPSPQSIFEGLAKDQTVQSLSASIGEAGPTPSGIPGSGVIGWLRSIFDKTLTETQLRATPLAVDLPGVASEATLAQVRDAIQAQINVASTVWTDNSGNYFVRRDIVDEGTGTISVTFSAPDGSAASPGAGLRPLAAADRDVTQTLYDATASGDGYAAGDILARLMIVDAQASPPIVSMLWVNLLSCATIPAPSIGSFVRSDEVITVENAAISHVDESIGDKSTAAASDDVGPWSVVALIKRLLAKIPSISDDAPLPVRITEPADGYSASIPVAGKNSSGGSLPIAVNDAGAVILADAPAMITGRALAVGNVLCVVDTLGYQSVSAHLFGTFVATVQMEGSNTGQDWRPVNGLSPNGASAAVASQMTAVGTIHIPAVTRYVRFLCTAYTSGLVLLAAQLRSSPVQNLQPNQPINIALLAGTAPATAGVAGLPAHGGPTAVGAAPGAAQPVQVSGWDGSFVRRFLTDRLGALYVRGAGDAQFPDGVLRVQESIQGTAAENSVPETLGSILRELRVTNLLIKELSVSLQCGIPITDEIESIRNDMSTINLN